MKYKRTGLIALALTLLLGTTVRAFPIFQEKPPEEARVPIIMYHLVTKNSKYHGKYGISPEEFESDLRFLSENGYETVVISDLIRFVERRESLPDKPVVLTFDDGCSSDYYHVYPLLEKYGMNAVMSIVGKLTDEYSSDSGTNKKPHLTWEQVEEMHKSGSIEFQNHSYNLHGDGGSGKRSGETEEAYAARLSDDLGKAQERIKENINYTPKAFTYPLGIVSNGAEAVLREMGFEASLSCAEGMNVLKQDEPECLFRLKRNIRRSGSSIEQVLKKIEK